VRLSAQARYAAPAGQVAAILADPGFVRQWMGDLARPATPQIAVTGAPPGPFTVSIRAQLPASELPTQARHLVPGALDVRQVAQWEAVSDDGTRQGSVALDIVGVPLKLSGHAVLAPLEDSECELRYAIDLTSSIPLLGTRIEQAAAQVVRQGLDAERQAMRARLAA
jgi:hypothetical protein